MRIQPQLKGRETAGAQLLLLTHRNHSRPRDTDPALPVPPTSSQANGHHRQLRSDLLLMVPISREQLTPPDPSAALWEPPLHPALG